MEIFNFEKDIDEFLNNKIAVNCITEEDANQFLKILKDKYSVIWNNGDILIKNNWEDYAEKTCYFCNNTKRLKYGPKNLIEDYEDINEFYQFNSNSKQNSNIEENVNVKQSKKRRITILEDD